MILIFGGVFAFVLDQFDLYEHFPSKSSYLIPMGLIFLISYYLFLYNKRYKAIEKRYLNENRKQKLIGVLYLFFIAFVTISAYFGLFIVE